MLITPARTLLARTLHYELTAHQRPPPLLPKHGLDELPLLLGANFRIFSNSPDLVSNSQHFP